MLLYLLVYTFVAIPIIDAIVGEDHHNPPEAVVRAMSRDNYYRALLYVGIVLLYASFRSFEEGSALREISRRQPPRLRCASM